MVVGVNFGPLVSSDTCRFALGKEARLMSLAEKDVVVVAFEVGMVVVGVG